VPGTIHTWYVVASLVLSCDGGHTATVRHSLGRHHQILLWPTYSTGAGSRVSLGGQIARLPRRNLCSPLPLSGGSTHGLVPRDKAPWKSPQPTGHPPHGCQSGQFAGTADPRLGELTMCRPLTRGILKKVRNAHYIVSYIVSCDASSSTTEQGLPFLQLALWSLDDEFAEQSSALRSPSMC
jgi:hypothetical protein